MKAKCSLLGFIIAGSFSALIIGVSAPFQYTSGQNMSSSDFMMSNMSSSNGSSLKGFESPELYDGEPLYDMEPQDLGLDEGFSLNARMIAEELSSLSPVEIRDYPIMDLSAGDLALVLSYLSPSNLAKVLLNIPLESLLSIETMLSPATFEETMDRLPVEDRTLLENRFSVSQPGLIQ